MLGKLFKYEFKSTARTFLPLYGALLVFALINRVFFSLDSVKLNLPMGIAMTAFVGIIIGICVLTLIVTIQRFYKNLLTDEGYLMFTLPASSAQLISSKLLVATLWTTLSTIVTIIAIMILVVNSNFLSDFTYFFQYDANVFFEETGVRLGIILIEIFVYSIILTISSVMMIYASISIGHLVNRNKIIASFGAFLALSICLQTLTNFCTNIISDLNLDIWFYNSTATAIHLLFLFGIVFTVLISAIFYGITAFILKKRLNLE